MTPSGSAGRGTRRSAVQTIFTKEFREIFRDRRTVMSVVIGPLLITPLLFALMGRMIQGQINKARVETHKIGLIGANNAPALAERLQNFPNTQIEEVTQQDAEARIGKRTLDAAIEIPAGASTALSENGTVSLTLYSDPGEQKSATAAGRLESQLDKEGQKVVGERLKARGLPETFSRPFVTQTRQVSSSGGGTSLFLVSMLPYIMFLSMFTGSMYAAFDQVAGEKERGTLETLLVSPASRRDIVAGKFGAVVCVCLISAVLSVTGLVISFKMKGAASVFSQGGGLSLTPSAAGIVLLCMVPVAILFAGILLAVSTFARNQKEAQTYMGPLMTMVLIPVLASMFIGTDAGLPLAFVPILNAAVIIKQALSSSYNSAFIAIAIGSSIAYAAIALAFATRLFQKESVLLKG